MVGGVKAVTVHRVYHSSKNIFGISRKYTGTVGPSSHDPEDFVSFNDLSGDDICAFSLLADFPPNPIEESGESLSAHYPYPNKNAFLLGDWYWCGGAQKSQQSFRRLVSIVGDPEFKPEDINTTRWDKVNEALATESFDGDEWEDDTAGWKKTPVTISVPFPAKSINPGPKDYTLNHFYHRSFVSVIREKLKNEADNQHFHYEPFELRWEPTGHSGFNGRVQGELYSSPEFERAHRILQDSPSELGCSLPRVVVALMFWSDSTHLTSFGKANLWPLYMGFGNESKYRRCKPSLHLLNHVAYFEKVWKALTRMYLNLTFYCFKLPDSFKDFANRHIGGKGPSSAFLTHCNRELLHAQWKILLDDEFIEAYTHGIIVMCCDGKLRRFYPRLFTYSADYPEK